MTWQWERCKFCRREVHPGEIDFDPVTKITACRECRQRRRKAIKWQTTQDNRVRASHRDIRK